MREVAHKPNIVKMVRDAVGKKPLAGYRSAWCGPCYCKHLMFGVDLWNLGRGDARFRAHGETAWKTINEIRIEKGLARITGTRYDQIILDDILDHTTVAVDFEEWLL